MVIIPMLDQHATAVLDIYAQGMRTGYATFETIVPPWDKFDKKFLPHSRFVVMDKDKVAGWVGICPISPRECYKGVAEISIFMDEDYRGRGLGKQLMMAIIEESESNGIWTLQSLVHSDNLSSIHLHEILGFRVVGYRERIAQLNGVWKTNMLLERRSKNVGL